MKLIIFDCDGTIVDSQHVIVAAMDHAFAALRLEPPPRHRVLGVVGLSLDHAIERLIDDPEPGVVPALCEYYKLAFASLRKDPGHIEPLFPNAREVMTQLAGRDEFVLGIATGKSRRGVDALFEREGLAPYFVTIQTADDHPSKPHPSMIHKAMSEVGADIADTIMIGDTTFDMEMAVAAGAGAIGVSWGYHSKEELVSTGVHALIDSFVELPPAIDTHFDQRRTVA